MLARPRPGKYEEHNKLAELTDNVGFAGVVTPIPLFLETV